MHPIRRPAALVALAAALAALGAAPARALPITYAITATGHGGPLDGQAFGGTVVADSAVVTLGHGNVQVAFTLLGATFTNAQDAFGLVPVAAFDGLGNLTFLGNFDILSPARATAIGASGGTPIPAPVSSFVLNGTFDYGISAASGETATGGLITARLAPVTAIPEPAAAGLLGLAFAGLALLRRRPHVRA